jgi:2Fe-2S ferredoxin
MPTIVFERTGREVDWPEGGRLLDLCDREVRAGVPFSCRDANCGTCRVRVVEGLERCEPPGDDERALLEILGGGDPSIRLACQLRVRAGDGRVRLWVTL